MRIMSLLLAATCSFAASTPVYAADSAVQISRAGRYLLEGATIPFEAAYIRFENSHKIGRLDILHHEW